MSDPNIPREDEDVEGHGGARVRFTEDEALNTAPALDTDEDDDDVEGHGGSKVR